MSRVVSDTERIEPLVAHNIPDLIVNSLMITGIAAILFYLDARLALLTLLPIPLLLLAAVTLGGRTKEAFKHAQARLADFSALLQDNISGIKEIQIFTRERYEGQRVRRRSERYTVDLLTALRIMAIYHPTVEFLARRGRFSSSFSGAGRWSRGLLPVEDLVAFFLYQSMLYQPIMLLARMNEQVQMALASSERVADLLDEEPDVKEAKSPVTLGRVRGEIVFENVDFSYVPGVEVLKGISFRVRPGESLALVGPTGVGKSTIASLIPRFYDPTGGRHPHRRRRHPQRLAPVAPGQYQHGAAGYVSLQRDRAREHPLRQPRKEPGGGGRGGPDGQRPRVHHGAARRLRHPHRRAGRQAVGRAKAAPLHRPGDPEGRAASSSWTRPLPPWTWRRKASSRMPSAA